MSKSGKLIAAIIIVTVIAVGAIVLTNKKSEDKASNTNTNQSNGNDQGNMATDVSIKYDGSTFTLSADSIVTGGTVTVTNNSDKKLAFDSDPHPVHTDNTELNVGNIEPGESKTFTLNTTGTWGFHNHLDSSQNGELTVKPKPTN